MSSAKKPRKSSPSKAKTPARPTTQQRSGRGGKARSTRPPLAPLSRPSLFARLKASWERLPAERRLDVLGVLLTLSGLILFLSLISAQNGALSRALIGFLRRLAGWGSLVIPLAMMGSGIWLILRRIERLPAPSGTRWVGLALLYLNILAWTHWIAGEGLTGANVGRGGGFLGYGIANALLQALGGVGTGVVLLAWLLASLTLTLDVSLSIIVSQLLRVVKRAAQALPRSQPAPTHHPSAREPESEALPPEFEPLPGRPQPPRERRRAVAEAAPKPAPETPAPATAGESSPTSSQPAPEASPWVLPPLEAILEPPTPAASQDTLDHERAKIIEDTLASFGAPVHVVDISHGPTVTRFGVEPDFIETRAGRTRVRVSRIVSLADDLALALAAPRIRIQAPVPGKHYVGIEVPNVEISRVSLREVMESEAFKRLRSPLRFALGKDVAGRPVAADLAAMPHLLIAGTTGSGKSVCVNAILTCLLLNNTPADLRLVLVDPKRVELTGYNGIPHLLTPVVVDTERVIGALQWLQREMDARYHKFAQVGVRNLQEYNARHQPPLPYLVAVIDELADLMMLSPDETERSITRLAQLARATGIHLIIATQRPSVDVVTGLIKANFPARIAFAVASSIDSRVILDQPGAERLLGRGDMLFQAPDAAAPVRLQGTFVSDVEIQRLVDYWRTAAAQQSSPAPSPSASGDTAIDLWPAHVPLKQGELWDTEGGDPLLAEAIDLVRREGRASVTMLQRRLRIGYTRAARLIDAMEEKGIISPALPNSPVREVLDYGPAAPPAEE